MDVVTIQVTPKDPRKLNPKLKIDLSTVTSIVEAIKKLNIDPAAVEAIVASLHLDPAQIAEMLKLDPVLVNTIIDKVKDIDPATVAAVIDEMKNGKLPKIDVSTVTSIIDIFSKIPLNDTVKSLLLKLAVFAFGIFCGIGIVYKSGLPLPSDVPPPVNVSVYQKRIDELQKINSDLQQENNELHRTPNPAKWVNPEAIRPGFILPK